jgi:phage terminase small subunit
MARPGPKPLPATISQLFKDGLPKIGPDDGPEGLPVELQPIVPPAPMGELVAPPELVNNPGAVEYFYHYVSNVGTGHLKPIDVPLLTRLCHFQAMFDQLILEYLSSEAVTTTETGYQTPNPRFSMLTKLAEVIRKFSIELALTPSERVRMKGGANAVQDADRERRLRELKEKYLGPRKVA